MNDNFQQQLLDGVRMTMSPTPENIKKSEELLMKTLITNDNYGLGLMKIASDKSLQEKEFAVRQSAAIVLEKTTK